jgi:MtN3 and saliva related transmembrane protein
MRSADVLGLIAGLMTSLALLPQLYEVFWWSHTAGFSIAFAVWYVLGVLVWVAYGVALRSADIIAFNALSAILMTTILVRVCWLRHLHVTAPTEASTRT